MKRKMQFIKPLIVPLLVILAVYTVALVSVPSLARYIRGTADLKNKLQSVGSADPKVNADWTITVEDKGYPVYVRVEVIISWKNKDGEVLYVKPKEYDDEKKEGDYIIKYSDDWVPITRHDADKGYQKTYYYFIGSDTDNEANPTYLHGVVKSGCTTTAIIKSFEDKKTNSALLYDGYELNVEIIVQTVQAVGYTDDDTLTACEDAWGLAHGALTPNTDSNTEGGNGTTGEENEGTPEESQP